MFVLPTLGVAVTSFVRASILDSLADVGVCDPQRAVAEGKRLGTPVRNQDPLLRTCPVRGSSRWT